MSSYFWGKSYARLAKISFCNLDERFGEKQLCWESAQTFFFIVSGIRAKGFQNFDWIFLAEWSQPHSACPDEVFFNFWRREMKEKLLPFENFALLSFSDFERKRSLVLLQAWLRRLVKKSWYMFRRRFFTKKVFGRPINFSSFPEMQQNFFKVLTRKFRQGGHNYFYKCT